MAFNGCLLSEYEKDEVAAAAKGTAHTKYARNENKCAIVESTTKNMTF